MDTCKDNDFKRTTAHFYTPVQPVLTNNLSTKNEVIVYKRKTRTFSIERAGLILYWIAENQPFRLKGIA